MEHIKIKNGFSLVELTIAMGISGILALTTVSFLNMQTKFNKDLQTKVGVTSLHSEISYFLQSSEGCKANIIGKNITSFPINLTSLNDSGATQIYSLNKIYGAERTQITSMQLTGFSSDITEGVKDIGYLTLNLSYTEGENTTSRPVKMLVAVEDQSGNDIVTDCLGGAPDPWVTAAGSIQTIAQLGIGVTAPTKAVETSSYPILFGSAKDVGLRMREISNAASVAGVLMDLTAAGGCLQFKHALTAPNLNIDSNNRVGIGISDCPNLPTARMNIQRTSGAASKILRLDSELAAPWEFSLESGGTDLKIRGGTGINPDNKLMLVGASGTVVGTGNPADAAGKAFFVYGTGSGTEVWHQTSDQRLKKNIETIKFAEELLRNIRGVEFEWRQELIPREGRDLGFIAQELEEVVPEVVSNNGQRLSVGVSSLNALLVEAIKNLNSKFKDDKSLFFEFMSEFCSEQKNSSLCQKVNL